MKIMINFIYILDPSGSPIFIRENYIQWSEEFNHSLLSGFITALQNFATQFGGEELEIADLGNKTILILLSSSSFKLKNSSSASSDKWSARLITGILISSNSFSSTIFPFHITSSLSFQRYRHLNSCPFPGTRCY